MTRAVLYARYSSDSQREASIEDQLRICRERAAREGWTVADAYSDAAISGASMIQRRGIQYLLQDAQAGKFEIVLAEALDRISRDQADVATLFKHLRFAGVTIVTIAEGEITELHVGLKGTPIVRNLRPRTPWPDVAAAVSRATGAKWTVERLRRSVGRLVNEGLADRKLLARAPRSRRRRSQELAVLVQGIALANPGMSLRGIGEQLEAMKIPTPANKPSWTAPSVAHLLRKVPGAPRP